MYGSATATDQLDQWPRWSIVIRTYSSGQVTTIEIPFSAANYSPGRDPWLERELRRSTEALRKYQEWRKRLMECQGHRMPPVSFDLAALPIPEPPVNARTPDRGPWLAGAQGARRERASHRRRLRVWERAAA